MKIDSNSTPDIAAFDQAPPAADSHGGFPDIVLGDCTGGYRPPEPDLVGTGGLIGPGSPFYSPPTDASANSALGTLQSHELGQDLQSFLRGGGANHLTGNEVMGAVLEGVMDPGGESQELGQFQSYLHQHAADLSPSGERVSTVVDKFKGIADQQGGTLTQGQKAQMAGELADAAKGRFLDGIGGLIPKDPGIGIARDPGDGTGRPTGVGGGSPGLGQWGDISGAVAPIAQRLPTSIGDAIAGAVAPIAQRAPGTLGDAIAGAIGTAPPTPGLAGGKIGDAILQALGDQSANTAINTLKQSEGVEGLISRFLPDHGTNKLTGSELSGAVLEGVLDPGNEARELTQFHDFAQQNAGKLDASGERVAGVVDKYLAIAQGRPDGSLTQSEKADLARELTDAAKTKLSDLFQPTPQIYFESTIKG